MSRAAVFFDRDGTLIEDPDFLSRPEQVRLLPGAAAAVRRLRDAGYATIVVTNQSGIARGLLSEGDYAATATRLEELLAAHGAVLDAQYHCPHLPEITGPCECRKPGTLLYRRAAADLGVDLSASWWIGDKERDVTPAEVFGGRGVLLGREALDIGAAADLILAPGGGVRLVFPPVPMRVAVCASGRGSNLGALLEALGPDTPARVVLVLSNRPDAGALDLARSRGVPVGVFEDHRSGDEWIARLEAAGVDLVVLAGYLKLVPAAVVSRYRGRVVNIHPALLPDFGGPGMYGRRVHEAVLASGARESGATVHLVDEEYDRGVILAQARVPVAPDDSPERLADRVLAAEHRLLPQVVLAAARAGRPVPLPEPLR
jgi:formyltetrahydrofolate-dependent phosphoribosylglycinamide formyltransferase